jgi:hypothetical protein
MEKQTTDKGPVDHRDDNRSLFAGIVLLLGIALAMVITVVWLALVVYGVSALFKWIAG